MADDIKQGNLIIEIKASLKFKLQTQPKRNVQRFLSCGLDSLQITLL